MAAAQIQTVMDILEKLDCMEMTAETAGKVMAQVESLSKLVDFEHTEVR